MAVGVPLDQAVPFQVDSVPTVIVIVAVAAHNPAVGVNVYSVVTELSKGGVHVPVIGVEFVENVGNAANKAPEAIGSTCVNVGVTIGFTVIVIVAVVTQVPAVGVKV
jgi:hypothetical protein